MASSSTVLSVLSVFVIFSGVVSKSVTYNVTFVPCTPNSNCPTANPTRFNATFALNGTISPNVTLNVGDRLEFDLSTNVPIHPLTICQNIGAPNFCMGANGSSLLNTPITVAGTNTSVNFNTVGIYYYGCQKHPGMGATISVITGIGHLSSASSMLVAVIALFTVILAF